ncbi:MULTISPECIES: winged helix-turn-helix transcriptional regulator [Herbaspirillum]|uniref:HxlR family transcriptional regulator n=1 Tax=Herbaspirillum frisingense GSF30 TaxID=864073 RepID=A0AAI9ID80_9BURK|nr:MULTISPECIES: helix-turn-helix domain-containing protein [Herbaspirillum]EOA03859.1 HxlR family transcriptional regulator [Herbaspirillum frisingense GSF30]MCI1013934.1 helix-turn-helix transcriptional regulator [Herbaspirillum sp. C7C2]UIN20439.1 helix-turn-helix transcriptional regulator [Herbaspirillum frisingense]
MQRKRFDDMQCPIARSLDRVGEWWSILILRDAFYGLSRFDEFQKHLEIAPNILTRRLAGLVEQGLLEKVQYSERPPRYEYHLTPRGRDFRPVLLALLQWGNTHFAPEGAAVILTDVETGKQAIPMMVDANTGKPITPKTHIIAEGPAASDKVKRSIAELLERRAAAAS